MDRHPVARHSRRHSCRWRSRLMGNPRCGLTLGLSLRGFSLGLMPRTYPGAMRFGLSLGFLGGLGLRWREITAKAKSDSTSSAESAFTGSAAVVQMIGIDVIERSRLNSDMTKEPIINSTTPTERHGSIRQGSRRRVAKKIRPVLAKEAVCKHRDPAGAISVRVAWPKHVGNIVAGRACSTRAIAKGVAADVGLNREMVEPADSHGKIPSIQLQLLGGRLRAEGLVIAKVGVAGGKIDWDGLSGSDAEQKKSCQSDVDKFSHVPCIAPPGAAKNDTTERI